MTDLEQAQHDNIAPWDLIVPELCNFHVAVFKDRFPVTTGHLLFVPKYNTLDIIREAFYSAILHGDLLVKTGMCEAYNVGINMGEAAGQTVMYPHVHLIPRKHGDCADPVGGVRSVVFGQANYKSGGYQLPK